ncbi:MAG: hypothetical protein J2P41_03545 [Blastocatellia bacterium]|nr:hypothetical protein [Blastocatellia bacterium]
MSFENAKNAIARSFGPGIVRGWFDAVLNPIIQSMRYQIGKLNTRDLSWQASTGTTDSLLPIKRLIPPSAEDTLEQFLNFFSDCKEKIYSYEEARQELEHACGQLQRALEDSLELRAIYDKACLDNSTGFDGNIISSVFTSYRNDIYHMGNLAQSIVNQVNELPADNPYAPVWIMYREQFIALLDLPEIKGKLQIIEQERRNVLQKVVELVKSFKNIREDLSIQHDVPYLPPEAIYHR